MQSDQTRRELDMHEKAGLDYKNNVRRSFLWCCETFPTWKEIPCVKADDVRYTKDEVHEMIYQHLSRELL
jgi:dTMP kinase